jgi:hypothetical protein
MKQSIEDGPGKFETSESEMPRDVEGTDLNGPEPFDTEEIRGQLADIPTEAESKEQAWRTEDGNDKYSDAKTEIADSQKEGTDEIRQKQGGSFRELQSVLKEGQERHHMPADIVSPLERNDGPAIIMDKGDHRQTASCGYSKEAQEYRSKQAELIKQGKFDEAVQMDIDDLKDKFGNKYDQAIDEMKEYAKQLHEEGEI